MSHSKPHLLVKTCAHCGRPFAWRKRWERCWAEVRYCSRRCRLSVSMLSEGISRDFEQIW